MDYKNLHSLADQIILEELLLDNYSIVVNAQDSSFTGNVVAYVKSLYDPEKPYSSILSFMGPALLYATGFKWMALIYELMEALGFDWKTLWHRLGETIVNIVKGSNSSESSPEDIGPQIDKAVEEHVSDGFSGEVNTVKVQSILTKGLSSVSEGLVSENNQVLVLKAFGNDLSHNFIKQASIKSKLTMWLVKKLGFILKTALIGVGLAGAGAVVSGIAGGAKPLSSITNGGEPEIPSTPEQPKIPLSTKAPRELFTFNRNDLSSVWIEPGDINNISNELMTWILSAYPQLNDQKDKIQSSSTFQNIIQKFIERNRLANGTGLLAVPRPYQRRIDIVNAIILPFTKENPNS